MNIYRVLGVISAAILLTTATIGRSEEPSPAATGSTRVAPADTGGMKHGGMMMGGKGMMGMGGCPMMMEKGEKLEVEKIEKGVRLTFTSDDPKVVSRIQKRAEIMRLMRELHESE